MVVVFIGFVLGHLVGDYLLQSKKMALMKTQKGWRGLLWCTVHCILYTASVCLLSRTFSWSLVAKVFLSHYPIDRYCLGDWWLKMIRGRDFKKAYSSTEPYHEIDLAFSCLVYAVADNTLHVLLLWLIAHTL